MLWHGRALWTQEWLPSQGYLIPRNSKQFALRDIFDIQPTNPEPIVPTIFFKKKKTKKTHQANIPTALIIPGQGIRQLKTTPITQSYKLLKLSNPKLAPACPSCVIDSFPRNHNRSSGPCFPLSPCSFCLLTKLVASPYGPVHHGEGCCTSCFHVTE